jgi:hypothetical protein
MPGCLRRLPLLLLPALLLPGCGGGTGAAGTGAIAASTPPPTPSGLFSVGPASFTLPVAVSYSPAPFYLQPPPGGTVAVTQGQTLTLPLYLWPDDTFFVPVGGKPALLRVQLLADRAGVAAPPLTATVLSPGTSSRACG